MLRNHSKIMLRILKLKLKRPNPKTSNLLKVMLQKLKILIQSQLPAQLDHNPVLLATLFPMQHLLPQQKLQTLLIICGKALNHLANLQDQEQLKAQVMLLEQQKELLPAFGKVQKECLIQLQMEQRSLLVVIDYQGRCIVIEYSQFDIILILRQTNLQFK